MNYLFVNPRFAIDTRPRMELYMDVVGTCNLRCPSCPVGNMGAINPSGLMDKAMFARILAKAAREYQITRAGLYSWAEAFLHPELPELIRIVRRHGIFCSLSTNLNLLRDPDELFRASPEELRISLSGFTQPVYSRTHAKGNIERVKENMRLLSEARRRAEYCTTAIHVYYHKYKHNLHEVQPMRDYATSLGFAWLEDWAFYMPLEKVIDAVEGNLDADERAFLEDQFALPIVEAVHAAEQFRKEPCRMWEEQIVLDVQGNAMLCCGIYDSKANTLGAFLDLSPEQLVKAKTGHPTCDRCTQHGIHRYFDYFRHPQLRPMYAEMTRRNLEESQRSAAVRTALPVV